jgi:hypothetical protein
MQIGLLPVIATHIGQVASGVDLGPCRAWKSAAFLTALAGSWRKVARGVVGRFAVLLQDMGMLGAL